MGNGPCTPHYRTAQMNKSWLIRRAAQYLGKMKEETVGENMGPMNSGNYLPHWPRSRTSLGKGRHLKLNLAKSYKQKIYPNYTLIVMETWKTYLVCSIDSATKARCCSLSCSRYKKMEKFNGNINE